MLDKAERFKMLCEYTDTSGAFRVNEVGEENPQQQDPNMAGADPSMGGGDPNMAGADPNMMGADPSMAGADPSMGGGDPGMGADPNADPNMGGQGPEGFAPQGADMQQPPMEGEEDGEDEEVIDVDELVNAQKKASHNIKKLSMKFDDLMGKLDSIEQMIDSNNQRMSEFKDEMEKRNPTPVEKLSLRSKDSYPFNVSPDEYWDEKEATSNYSTDDVDPEKDTQYKITKDEIDNFNDYASVSKTLDDKYSLKDYFNF